jgi:nitroreductase
MSVKTAVPDHPILELIAERWSPRVFADRAVEPEKLRSLFEAARWAASSFNGQPWRFFVSTRDDAEGFEKLAGCLNPGNAWAKKAPVLALSVASLNFENNNAPNRSAVHDVGLAVGNLSLQATSMGIYLHQMAGFSVDTARQVLGIPESFAPVAMIAIGYLGDPNTLPDDLRARETAARQRKPIGQFLFSGSWGNVAGIVEK